jgi:hypothetical protein
VQAIIVAIDQYAEAATGNREFFLNKPPTSGRARQGDLPWRVWGAWPEHHYHCAI